MNPAGVAPAIAITIATQPSQRGNPPILSMGRIARIRSAADEDAAEHGKHDKHHAVSGAQRAQDVSFMGRPP